MQDITQAALEARLPELAAPEGDTALFDKVLPYARRAVTGQTTPQIGGADPSAVLSWADTEDELAPWLNDYAVFRGVYDALPHLDVIATGTGFGIVSTQNLAPASRERVEAVRESVRHLAAHAYDHILAEYLMAHDECRTFLPTTAIARAEGVTRDGKGVSMEELEALAPQLALSLMEVQRAIGTKMAGRLLSAQFLAPQAEQEALAPAVQTCRRLAAIWCAGGTGKASPALHNRLLIRLRQTLDQTPEAYAEEWHTSPERAAWHSGRYQNSQDSPVYFFG